MSYQSELAFMQRRLNDIVTRCEGMIAVADEGLHACERLRAMLTPHAEITDDGVRCGVCHGIVSAGKCTECGRLAL